MIPATKLAGAPPGLRRLERACVRGANLLACAGLSVLIAFAFATLLDGLSRFFLSAPIEAVGDLGSGIVAACVAACFPLAQLQRSNISIEVLGTVLGRRGASILRAFAAILVAVALVAIARQMFRYAADAAEGGDSTVMLGIPTAPFWYVVAAMFAAACVAQLLVAVLSLAQCRRAA